MSIIKYRVSVLSEISSSGQSFLVILITGYNESFFWNWNAELDHKIVRNPVKLIDPI